MLLVPRVGAGQRLREAARRRSETSRDSSRHALEYTHTYTLAGSTPPPTGSQDLSLPLGAGETLVSYPPKVWVNCFCKKALLKSQQDFSPGR